MKTFQKNLLFSPKNYAFSPKIFTIYRLKQHNQQHPAFCTPVLKNKPLNLIAHAIQIISNTSLGIFYQCSYLYKFSLTLNYLRSFSRISIAFQAHSGRCKTIRKWCRRESNNITSTNLFEVQYTQIVKSHGLKRNPVFLYQPTTMETQRNKIPYVDLSSYGPVHTGANPFSSDPKLERIGLAYTRDLYPIQFASAIRTSVDRISTDPIQNWCRCETRLIFIIKYKGFLYAVRSLFSHPHYFGSDPYQWRAHGT